MCKLRNAFEKELEAMAADKTRLLDCPDEPETGTEISLAETADIYEAAGLIRKGENLFEQVSGRLNLRKKG
ncbi:hypothetical protein A2482_03115 [Candidatus Falkowbacteria bacterium RIFOXYC2_FULL_48_21]|uniref:Uncharacterized protein n=1 Tax=Candidatus Falkowbacteria bacterium RIFOXYC2_FULL_48_21 TaxID=1798005 RepID=A0A1F5T8J3_9BACT|nr:MAG: hypothetical protein A2482_03115 [Candidatus Falkowbacteria bacterium RIFOXYC2_FULL_48_21]